MLQYFETIFYLRIDKIGYILWVMALLEAWDVTNNGRPLGFYQELEIRLKPPETVNFCA